MCLGVDRECERECLCGWIGSTRKVPCVGIDGKCERDSVCGGGRVFGKVL